MSDDTPSPLNNVITIDDERIKSHFDRVVRGTMEETLNASLDAEADRLYRRQPLQLWSLSLSGGHYPI
jgi:putative transposase